MAGMGWHGAPLKPLSWFDKFKLLFPEWIPWWVRPHGLDLKQREVSYLMEVSLGFDLESVRAGEVGGPMKFGSAAGHLSTARDLPR